MYSSHSQPLVTVCIPSFNHGHFIQEAIASVIEQNYRNIELIVIDDGSQDDSKEKIESMRDQCEERFGRFVFISQENQGVSASLNRMLHLAKGEYISLLASDDKYEPHKLSILIENVCDYDVIFSDALFIDEKSNIIDKGSFISIYDKFGFTNSRCNEIKYEQILRKNMIPALSVLYKKSALAKVDFFDENLRLEDWDIYLKMLKNGNFKFVNNVLGYYRYHGENSIIKENKRLLTDTLIILNKNKQFAFDNNFTNIWVESYYDAVYSLFKNHGVFTKINLIHLFKYLSIKIKYRLFNVH